MEIRRECLDFSEGYWGQASRAALKCRRDLGYSLLRTGDFDEGYNTAYVGFDLAVRSRGVSDLLSFEFPRSMVLASLTQDDMAGVAAKGERVQDIPGMVQKWVDFFDEEIWDSLETVLARDKSLQQAENHLTKAFEACCAKLSLERESTPHLDKAHNDIWDVIRKHKSVHRSGSA